jgi:protein-L-isoaspartate(D-aspartate) O-methyltransferase
MALLAGEKSKVYGIEHIAELAQISIENTRADHPELLEDKRVEFLACDGRLGLAEKGPFDA